MRQYQETVAWLCSAAEALHAARFQLTEDQLDEWCLEAAHEIQNANEVLDLLGVPTVNPATGNEMTTAARIVSALGAPEAAA